ncbi:MAG: GntR family transcriptional regulator [Pseudonocardiales bacterium]|nr:MAG: GntR family transcriptional regulator [Pseudonocardiales bacterium]
MIEFRIERGGMAPYLQIVQQVKQALRLGWLEPGDKLPTVHEVATGAAVNPNTVLKAYRELEREGLAAGRPGQGTFIKKSLTQLTRGSLSSLTGSLTQWVATARAAGLDDDGIVDLVSATLRDLRTADTA